ncbi:MAG: ABC transporter ATP-binding protein [Candidatus Lokiarchaeota archaeon]|nr:ABC transporter ATP-binding protein [Candidatus Lokiarchaeota archaeon]
MKKSTEFDIQVKNVYKSYENVKALVNVSFDVKKGEIFGLLGPNGAGKSTILSIIECLREQDSGSISVLNLDTRTKANKIKRKIGVQLQNTSLIPDLKVVEQLQLYSKLYQKRLDKSEIMKLLKEVGLTEKANVLPRKLSGGQRQRLALAIAIINDPEILFLDEPTVGLDVQSRHHLWDIILEYHKRGRTIVLTTHYIEEVENLCHRVGIIDHGKIISIGAPRALINQLNGFSTIKLSSSHALDELKPFSNEISSQYKKNTIKIETQNIIETLSSLIDLIEKQNIGVDELLIEHPNLEDVFLKLTGRSIRS